LLNYQFGPIRSTGAAFAPDIPADGEMDVVLFWQATVKPKLDYQIVLQVLDDARQVVSVNELTSPAGGAYPTTCWRPEFDRVSDYHRLQLKKNLPVGRYWLAVAVYAPGRAIRLPVLPSAAGAPDTVFLGPLKIPPQPPAEQGFTPLKLDFADAVALSGVKVNSQELTAGNSLTVDLLWQGTGRARVDYTVFVHLLNEAKEVVAGHDSQPMNGTYPVTLWSAGEKVLDSHLLATDALTPGVYSLEAGLYNLDTGQRVPLPNGAEQATLPIQIVIVSK